MELEAKSSGLITPRVGVLLSLKVVVKIFLFTSPQFTARDTKRWFQDRRSPMMSLMVKEVYMPLMSLLLVKTPNKKK